MGDFRKKLKHAFAVDPPGPTEPTAEQKRAVDFLCEAIVRRHLTVPAIAMLEMSRPLNFMFASAMHVVEPAASVLTRLVRLLATRPAGSSGLALEDKLESAGAESYRRLRQEDWTPIAQFFEKRGSIDYVLQRIEELEEEWEKRQQSHKAARQQENEEEEAEGVEDGGVDASNEG